MPTSTLVHYTSSDASAPQLSGAAGTLLTVLDAILVNGYGAKPAAGWSKPIANAGNIGCYKNGAGSTGFNLVINDNGPNATSTFKEAWATGWETLAGIGAPVGTGSGQFPTPAQLLTTGHVVVRKSSAVDATTRFWRCYADKYTFYFFVQSENTANYAHLIFGDAFALAGTSDSYRCYIRGQVAENSAASTAADNWGQVDGKITNGVGTGGYWARGYGGGGGSKLFSQIGNTALSGIGVAGGGALAGTVQLPNSADNSIYVSGVRATEATPGFIRGRVRGMYHVCHAVTGFSDGQTITGTGDYAGKSFQILANAAAFVAFETSATVETN